MPDTTGATQTSASILAISPYSSLHSSHWFSQHWLLFHAPHLAHLMSFCYCSSGIKKSPKPHQIFRQHNCLCSYFPETQQYLLALSLELTEHSLGTSNSRAPVFIRSLATTGYHILTLLALSEH